MHHKALSLLAILGVTLTCSAPAGAQPRPDQPMSTDPAGTVFDDFTGPAGAPPSAALWDYDLGPWQDDGLQVYTNSPDNVRLDGDGNLVIQARQSGDGYTSARPVTRGKLSMLYGRVSARIKFPSGQGIWPAFWMLGADYPEVGWPRSGEIDLMELVNNGSTFYSTLHGPQKTSDGQGDTDYYGGVKVSDKVVGFSGPIADLTADFHEYWLNWQPNSIVIGVDGQTLATFTPASLPPGGQWVFDKPMYALLNIAVGGPWPGPPDASTPWPATMLVDWFKYTPN